MIASLPVTRPGLVAVSGLTVLAFAALAGLMLGVAVGAAFAVLCVAVLAWVLAARQEITVDGGRLVIRDGVGRLAWTRTFELERIRDLRVEPAPQPWQEPIRFDYEGRTHGFAATVDDASEAERIVARLREALR